MRQPSKSRVEASARSVIQELLILLGETELPAGVRMSDVLGTLDINLGVLTRGSYLLNSVTPPPLG
jgi:hypothetical protein